MANNFDTIKRYAPALLLSRLEKNPGPITKPFAESFFASLLFADISGFTALTEKLTKDNPNGVKDLAIILDEYIGKLVEIIIEHGGDIVKFAGDALFAIWKASADRPLAAETHRAVKCGLLIQKHLHNYEINSNISLSLRVGLGAGRLHALHIGGIFERWELLLAGNPMNQVSVAGKIAEPGEVVISTAVKKILEAMNGGSKKENGRFQLHEIDDSTRPRPLELPHISESTETALRSFIPRAILSRLDDGLDAWTADLRKVTVLFLKINGFSYTDDTPLQEIQDIMEMMQRQLYHYEGSINRFGIDDKGAILLAAFGLPPLNHDDDAVRALLAARELNEDFFKNGLNCNIGIATGKVFCGSVGSSSRCEYTMHGTNVNLAARLMQAAKTILCDENTYESARHMLMFERLSPVKIKGRNEPVRIYRPLL